MRVKWSLVVVLGLPLRRLSLRRPSAFQQVALALQCFDVGQELIEDGAVQLELERVVPVIHDLSRVLRQLTEAYAQPVKP